MSGPIARIILRVIAGIVMARMVPQPVIDELLASPDVEVLMTALVDASLGIAIWSATELYYFAAKRCGWPT